MEPSVVAVAGRASSPLRLGVLGGGLRDPLELR